MLEFLILRLQGVMQAWGGHTYEDYRPSCLFPTRSGLTGLLGACLGIERKEKNELIALSESFIYAVRADRQNFPPQKITDYHTIYKARKSDGSESDNPVVSKREYLCDARFTVALQFSGAGKYTLPILQMAITYPKYTPFLGRRSCPIGLPLFDSVVSAENVLAALKLIAPHTGTVYSEFKEGDPAKLAVRDVLSRQGLRQFSMRTVYIYAEDSDVPNQSSN
ncbi:MAG: type I-E CRISPR-associated protein Cas5/CasD [Elusimicrobia bacterium]|nr:type I-E CRISPR-associated protein Cas5/CasD [Elusimicrobiota bacterium]